MDGGFTGWPSGYLLLFPVACIFFFLLFSFADKRREGGANRALRDMPAMIKRQ